MPTCVRSPCCSLSDFGLITTCCLTLLFLLLLHMRVSSARMRGWMFGAAAAATLLLLCGLQFAAVFASGPLFGFQIHSWDDPREWSAALLKGARYIKIDPHFVRQPLCFFITGISDPRGCLLLSHDEPEPRAGTPFPTLEDGLAALESLLQQMPDIEHLTLALCFKYMSIDPKDTVCSEIAGVVHNPFISLVDDVHSLLVPASDASGSPRFPAISSRVTMILDGDGVPDAVSKPCLVQRWRPWNATFILGSNPLQALSSDNESMGYDRFQVLNPSIGPDQNPALNLEILARMDWGKFAHSPGAPFQLWEPSSQELILGVAGGYLSRTSHPRPLLYAINIDPVQFRLYVSPNNSGDPLTKLSQLPFSSAPPRVDGQRLRLFSVHAERLQQSIAILLSQQMSGTDGDSTIGRSLLFYRMEDLLSFRKADDNSNGNGNGNGVVEGWLDLTSYLTGQNASLSKFSQVRGLRLTSVCGSESALFEFSVDETSFNLTLSRVQKFQSVPPSAHSTLVSSFFGPSQSNDTDGLLVISVSETGNAVCISSVGNAALDVVNCLRNLPFVVVDASCRFVSMENAVLILVDAKKNVYGVLLDDSFAPLSNVSLLGVGSSVDFSVASATGGQLEHFALVVSDGYCWNSETKNKRPMPAMCDNVPASENLVLTYTTGTTSDLVSWLVVHGAEEDPPLLMSSCASRAGSSIKHGTLSTGSEATVAVFSTVLESVPVVLVSGTFVGSGRRCSATNSPGAFDCGCSLAADEGPMRFLFPM